MYITLRVRLLDDLYNRLAAELGDNNNSGQPADRAAVEEWATKKILEAGGLDRTPESKHGKRPISPPSQAKPSTTDK